MAAARGNESGASDRWCNCVFHVPDIWQGLCSHARFAASKADRLIRKATRGVNGAMLWAVCQKIKYHDPECIDLLRKGGPLVGMLAQSGIAISIHVALRLLFKHVRKWRANPSQFR